MRKYLLLLFPALLIIGIIITKPPAPEGTLIKAQLFEASLQDTLPALAKKIQFTEKQGLKLLTENAIPVYYFEYETDHEELLKAMAELSFLASSFRADTTCRIVTNPGRIADVKSLLGHRLVKSLFEHDNLEQNFVAYDCIKTPDHHILLLEKNSNRVIHIVYPTA